MGTPQPQSVAEPKYWHLKTVLSRALESEFAVGEVLPNERELAARFGVARATLRQALEQLELEGRLQRRRGVGTTVAPPRMGVDVGSAQPGWSGGPQDDWRLDGCHQAVPPAAVAAELGVPADQTVTVLRRIRRTDGLPVATELLYVPRSADTADEVVEEDAETVLAHLRRRALDGQERSVELGSAGAEEAKLLDRLPGAPVLVVTTRYRSEGRVVAVAVATYRADTCRLTFHDAFRGTPEPEPALAG